MASGSKHHSRQGGRPGASVVVVEFSGPGRSGGRVRLSGVDYGQLYEAAWLLDAAAREVRAANLGRAAGQVVPVSTGLENGAAPAEAVPQDG